MEVVVLPGFSIKNKVWAEEIRDHLASVFTPKVVYWTHWETGQADEHWTESEATKIVKDLSGEKINIVAKSIGTMVAMKVLKMSPDIVEKIVFCGLPTDDLHPGDQQSYEVLRNFPAEKFRCWQNRDDEHGNYEAARSFLQAINPQISVMSKSGSSHEYPYYAEIRNFLLLKS